MYVNIYKMTNSELDKCYIGSTIFNLKKRLSQHKYHFKLYKLGLYSKNLSSFNLLNHFGNIKIELLEKCNYNQRFIREGYYIKNNNCFNHVISGRTIKEYRNENKQKIKIQRHDYYLNHKDDILSKSVIYRNNNRQKIKQYNNRVIDCICGRKTTNSHKRRHERSNFHIDFVNGLSIVEQKNI